MVRTPHGQKHERPWFFVDFFVGFPHEQLYELYMVLFVEINQSPFFGVSPNTRLPTSVVKFRTGNWNGATTWCHVCTHDYWFQYISIVSQRNISGLWAALKTKQETETQILPQIIFNKNRMSIWHASREWFHFPQEPDVNLTRFACEWFLQFSRHHLWGVHRSVFFWFWMLGKFWYPRHFVAIGWFQPLALQQHAPKILHHFRQLLSKKKEFQPFQNCHQRFP